MELKNFIVSAYDPLWVKEVIDLFISEPYVYHVLEKNDRVRDYGNIVVAPFRRQSREDLAKDSRYVDGKYDKYVSILAKRLNEIHGLNRSRVFWKKALSMAFIRYVTIFHDLFERCETHFDFSKHVCNILSRESYYIPVDFEDHRNFFQNTDYGQEQIFSIYIKLFYPAQFKEIDQQRGGIKNEGDQVLPVVSVTLDRKMLRNPYSLAKKVFNKSALFIRKKQLENNIKVGIAGSYFSQENLDQLVERSNKKIYPLDLNLQLDQENGGIAFEKRFLLSEFEPDFDRFDKFFFSTLAHCMPKVFIEYYRATEDDCISRLNTYPRLRYIVSEGWLFYTKLSILLALAKERNIEHIHNEHNSFFHPYAGSFISHVCNMCDRFVTLGWDDTKIPNLIRGASLYPFSIKGDRTEKYRILYVSTAVPVKMPHYSAAYGVDEENGVKHLEYIKAFFKALGKDTLNELTYRAYPKFDNPKLLNDLKLLNYDKEYELAPFLVGVGSYSDISEPSRLEMLQSALVVIDYVSTSYIESLIMNIPTVFFFNPDTYYLNDEYSDFFQALVDVGICQTDPVQAASFIESIKDDPLTWWTRDDVQAARDDFISKNLGKPEVLIKYLLELVDSGPTVFSNNQV